MKVHFERRKQFNTSQFHASILVDGALVGSADNGKSFDVPFPVGTHTVTVRNEQNGPIGGNATETSQFTMPSRACWRGIWGNKKREYI